MPGTMEAAQDAKRVADEMVARMKAATTEVS